MLKASFEEALRNDGFQDPPGAAVKRSAVAIWAAACKSQTPMCKQGIDALQGFYAGKIRLDQSGTASVSGMPQGSFWILGTRYGKWPTLCLEFADRDQTGIKFNCV